MAFFVGGKLLLAVAVVPAERSAPERERLRAIARRYGYGSLVAILVLLAIVWLGLTRAPAPPRAARAPAR